MAFDLTVFAMTVCKTFEASREPGMSLAHLMLRDGNICMTFNLYMTLIGNDRHLVLWVSGDLSALVLPNVYGSEPLKIRVHLQPRERGIILCETT